MARPGQTYARLGGPPENTAKNQWIVGRTTVESLRQLEHGYWLRSGATVESDGLGLIQRTDLIRVTHREAQVC